MFGTIDTSSCKLSRSGSCATNLHEYRDLNVGGYSVAAMFASGLYSLLRVLIDAVTVLITMMSVPTAAGIYGYQALAETRRLDPAAPLMEGRGWQASLRSTTLAVSRPDALCAPHT